MDDGKGVSLVLIHSEKGHSVLGSISDKITLKCFPIEKAIMYNVMIVKSPSMPKTRDKYYNKMDQGKDFIDTLRAFDRIWRIKRMLNLLKRRIRKVLK